MRKCKQQYVVVTPEYFHGNGTFGTYEGDLGWIPCPGSALLEEANQR
jgi:hypothetical protein